MANDNLMVIFDPELEMAAIVNTELRVGWGPAMVGPQAGVILNAFIETTPFDITHFNSYDVKRAFDSFLESAGLEAGTPETPITENPVESDTGAQLANGNALAERTATGSTDVPPAQPADTDQPAATETTETASPSGQVIDCPNCGGSGNADGSTCGMCGGHGKLTIAATP